MYVRPNLYAVEVVRAATNSEPLRMSYRSALD